MRRRQSRNTYRKCRLTVRKRTNSKRKAWSNSNRDNTLSYMYWADKLNIGSISNIPLLILISLKIHCVTSGRYSFMKHVLKPTAALNNASVWLQCSLSLCETDRQTNEQHKLGCSFYSIISLVIIFKTLELSSIFFYYYGDRDRLNQ